MTSPVKLALKHCWDDLPPALQAHYRVDNSKLHTESGHLSVEYPFWLQWPLNLVVRFGILVNQREQQVPTTVQRELRDGVEYWQRQLAFSKKPASFSSHTIYHQDDTIIEFPNRLLGLRMKLSWSDNTLRYDSDGYVLNVAERYLRIPDWLTLGKASIEERALTDTRFEMDFRIRHPLLGEVFRYSGVFDITTHPTGHKAPPN